MTCPRCEAEIKPAFYCTKCGHVPPRDTDKEPVIIVAGERVV